MKFVLSFLFAALVAVAHAGPQNVAPGLKDTRDMDDSDLVVRDHGMSGSESASSAPASSTTCGRALASAASSRSAEAAAASSSQASSSRNAAGNVIGTAYPAGAVLGAIAIALL
ncbi:hypothetical protein CAAN1_10S05006 [[Candida] anglica]|uniref:Uncharacterized protein n=1 Tax=[Candida] anglica TaxID=148631 RepID=A0ABP0EG18_9ASCO